MRKHAGAQLEIYGAPVAAADISRRSAVVRGGSAVETGRREENTTLLSNCWQKWPGWGTIITTGGEKQKVPQPVTKENIHVSLGSGNETTHVRGSAVRSSCIGGAPPGGD